jgi:hypothetical protein
MILSTRKDSSIISTNKPTSYPKSKSMNSKSSSNSNSMNYLLSSAQLSSPPRMPLRHLRSMSPSRVDSIPFPPTRTVDRVDSHSLPKDRFTSPFKLASPPRMPKRCSRSRSPCKVDTPPSAPRRTIDRETRRPLPTLTSISSPSIQE